MHSSWFSTTQWQNHCPQSDLNEAQMILYRCCDQVWKFCTRLFLFWQVTKTFERLVRLGKAKRTKTVKADSGTDQWEGGVLCQSEFEENDDDLASFLQNNTSFLLNMTKTAGFSVPWWTDAIFGSPILFIDIFLCVFFAMYLVPRHWGFDWIGSQILTSRHHLWYVSVLLWMVLCTFHWAPSWAPSQNYFCFFWCVVSCVYINLNIYICVFFLVSVYI